MQSALNDFFLIDAAKSVGAFCILFVSFFSSAFNQNCVFLEKVLFN